MPLASYFARGQCTFSFIMLVDRLEPHIIRNNSIWDGENVITLTTTTKWITRLNLASTINFATFGRWVRRREKTVTAVSRSMGPFRRCIGLVCVQSAQGAHSRTIFFERAITRRDLLFSSHYDFLLRSLSTFDARKSVGNRK